MNPAFRPGFAALACVLAGAVAGPAFAQQRFAPALTRFEPTGRDWTIHAEVRLLSGRPLPGDFRQVNPTPSLQLTSVDIVYPLIPDTASSIAEHFRFKGELWVANRMITNTPRILEGYQGLSSIAIWEASGIRARDLTLKVDIASRCFETRIDERIARSCRWPTHPWDPQLALCLEPQLFVEVQDPAIVEMVAPWIRERRLEPYMLAKRLAAETLLRFRRTQGLLESANRNVTSNPNQVVRAHSFLSGYRVNGAAYAARSGQGSAYDLACLLTAVYRAAGIPARMVIGYDIEASERSDHPVLRAWVEFFLARDPAQPAGVSELVPITPADGEWIPVDITRQQEFATRAPPVTQRWQYFGHNEELDMVPPIAFHWLPPSTLTNAGAPAIWGWLPQPANPVADQELKFWHLGTPQRGDDPDIRRR